MVHMKCPNLAILGVIARVKRVMSKKRLCRSLMHLPKQLPSRKTFLFLVLAGAVLFVIGQAVFAGLNARDVFEKQGNDDILRLLTVRDFIAGQGWFDVVQYRVLPPEGMPLHWSRFIDVGIAAIVVPLSYLVPMSLAELLGAVIWPTLIQLIALGIVSFSTYRLFGPLAASLSAICLVLWPVSGGWHSAPGNIDHHNMQMLMMTTMAVCAVWPGRAVFAGVMGGLAAAFSLAVGLEAVPFVFGVVTSMLARVLLAQTAHARQLLIAFCAALALGSTLFWVLQTPPGLRAQPMCDRLSIPMLSVVWTAVIASIMPMLIWRADTAALPRLVATVALTGLGMVLAWSLLATCLAGPYGDLPQDMQDFIKEGVGEALPGINYFFRYPETTLLFLPALTLTPLLVGFTLLNNRRDDGMTQDQRTALLGLGFLSLIGFGMMLTQMRATTLSASIIPIVVGYVLANQLTQYLRTRDSLNALGGLLLAVIFISPSTLGMLVRPLLPEPQGLASGGASCRTYEAMQALNEVPPSVLVTHFNIAPTVLWATHHNTVSAGYHTSAAALTNSVTPYRLDAAPLRVYLSAVDAEYFLLCANAPYFGEFATALAAGEEEVDWLRRVPLSGDRQVLFEILRE